MTKFVLEIETGNDAMNTDFDIAAALEDAAERISYDGIHYKPRKRIFDRNGNVVGFYEVVPA